MNPDIDKFPVPDTGATGIDPRAAGSVAPGQPVGPVLPTGMSPGPVMPQPPMPTPGAAAMPNLPTSTQPSAVAGSSIAHAPTVDDEEFEKKWVAIAKTIVERTKSDPYLQSQELSKAGKEYREQISGRGAS